MFKNIKEYIFDKFGLPKIEANHADVASFKIDEKIYLKIYICFISKYEEKNYEAGRVHGSMIELASRHVQ